MSEARKAQVRASLKKRRARLREQGICVDCGQEPARFDRVLCVHCAKNHSRRFNARYIPHPRPLRIKPPKIEKRKLVKIDKVERMIELAFKCRVA